MALSQQRARIAKKAIDQGQIRWSLADQIVVSGTNFLTGLLVARYLGIEQFGIFSLLWLVVLFAQSIQHAAIASPMLNLGPKQEAGDQHIFFSAMFTEQLAFGLAAGLIGAVIVFGAGVLAGHDTGGLPFALLIAVFLCQLQDFLRRYHFSRQRADTAFWTDLIRNGLQLAGLAILFLTDVYPSIEQIYYLIGAAALTGILAVCRSMPRTSSLNAIRAILPRQIQFSKWLVGSALMQWTTGNLYFLVAGLVLGPVAVGALKAAQGLLGINHIFFQTADNFVPPRAAVILHNQGRQALHSFIKTVRLAGLAATGTVALVFAVMPEFWLGLVLGETYAGYGALVVIMAMVYLVRALVMPLRYMVTAMEQTRILFFGSLIATIFTLCLSFPLVFIFNEYGAVTGMLLVQILLYANLHCGLRVISTIQR